MKKNFLLLLFVAITFSVFSQNKIVFPGITETQKQQLLNTKIAIPLPTWIPDGFAVTKIVTKTDKSIKLENKIYAVTYTKKLSNSNSLKFSIDAGFEGLGDLPYENGEAIKNNVGNIYLYYEPFEEDMNGKKVKAFGFIMTEWFNIHKLAFHASFNSQNPNDKPDNSKPKISKADVKKILQSLMVLK
ncbi:MAG TPA: hypothetical protein VIM07_08435 [Chitinophagaceae bacterium]